MSYIAYKISRLISGKRSLIIVPDDHALELFKNLKTFSPGCLFLPGWDVDIKSGIMPSLSVLRYRFETLYNIANGTANVVVTTPYGYVQPVMDPYEFVDKLVVLVSGSSVLRDDLVRNLVDAGYYRVSLVEERGSFSTKGDVVDVYPTNMDKPCRIEFWGDEIESIRNFDPYTQRSVDEVKSITIFPARELNMDTFLDEIFDFENVVIVNKDEVLSQWEDAEFRLEIDRNMPSASLVVDLFDYPDSVKRISTVNIPSKSPVQQIVSLIKELKSRLYRVYIVVSDETRIPVLKEMFAQQGIYGLNYRTGFISESFIIEDEKTAYISETELITRKRVRKRKRRVTKDARGELVLAIRSLKPGDYVIHRDHGIGVFRGLKRVDISDKKTEFMCIEYKDGDVLYVPIDKMNLVQKYIGSEASPPRLDKLGGTTWKRVRERVKKDVENFARKLLELQAKRKLTKGFAFSPDTPWQREFEEAFLYEETPDQLKAIEEVKKDMERDFPMDRLVCGDVGFGKTEVAMRAAFKAVMDGKQVAVLVPTTVLAEQHYETFKERFSGFPVEIEVLSRFKTRSEQKRILQELKSGKIDIIIGTHRLLSKDVEFKDLGLVIIDEEHKFGVRHKERFKELKSNVDILMLTATPIPRTLNMALSGLKDISIIETPPSGKQPVKTFVMRYRDDLLKNAIEREMKRSGSVFVVQPRIEDIEVTVDKISRLVPRARIKCAHGKMKASELEKIMYDFIKGRVDVLVSTAIVESGLDIPNANTLIVLEAEKFGLSQLYQLRGRVGRKDTLGYAYFLISNVTLNPEARERLKALQEFSELGSGLRLAIRDMEIRGVGNILGKEQSGNIADVGLEEYLNLLEDTINRLKGDTEAKVDVDPQLVVGFEAYIPEYYIPDDNVRIAVYKKVMSASIEELEDLMDELRDRFGQLPEEVLGIFRLSRLKTACKKAFVLKLVQRSKGFILEFVQTPLAVRIMDVLLEDERFFKKSDWIISTITSDVEDLCNILLKAVETASFSTNVK